MEAVPNRANDPKRVPLSTETLIHRAQQRREVDARLAEIRNKKLGTTGEHPDEPDYYRIGKHAMFKGGRHTADMCPECMRGGM